MIGPILQKRNIVLAVLVLAFIISRLIFLDSDIPIPQLTQYLPIDEMYYTQPAFNLVNYGEFTHRVVSYINDNGSPNNIFENIATALTLKVWGNNYYGLRMASVLAALLILIIFYLFLKNLFNISEDKPSIAENNKLKPIATLLIFLALTYLITDFSFLVASRVAEPTIFRMLAMVFLMFLMSNAVFTREKIPAPLTFLLGFLSLSSVLFVYFYNAFIFFAVGMTLLIWAWPKGWKHTARQMLFFGLGAALSLMAYKYFCQYVYGVTISDVIRGLVPFKSRMAGDAAGLIASYRHYAMNFLAIFATNIFRFNIAILFAFLVSLPVLIMCSFKEKNRLVILTANLLLFFMLQCIVINDFSFRKLIIMLPLVITSILIAYSYKDTFITSMKENGVVRCLFTSYWVFVGYLFVLFIYMGFIHIQTSKTGTDIVIKPHTALSADINRINLVVFLLVFVVVTMKYFYSKKVVKAISVLALTAFFVLPVYMDFQYVYMYPCYSFRNTMIAIKDKVDDKVVAGGVAYGFRLYNNSIPIMNFYSYRYSNDPNSSTDYKNTLVRLFRDKKADYTLQFNCGPAAESVEDMNNLGFKLEKRNDLISLYKQ